MSYKIFFDFAAGISTTLKVPKGTKEKIDIHVNWVESTLDIEREKYLDNPEHWKHNNYEKIEDKELCNVAEEHNKWVRNLYENFEVWSKKPPVEFEEITPDDFQVFLPALTFITVKPSRWTGDYYRARMETLYEVMRGRESEGISFNSKAMTEKQAAAVILLFSEFLDDNDLRLDVPRGHDYLASSSDGGYEWCEKCGAITYDDSINCTKNKCPLQKEYEEENNNQHNQD